MLKNPALFSRVAGHPSMVALEDELQVKLKELDEAHEVAAAKISADHKAAVDVLSAEAQKKIKAAKDANDKAKLDMTKSYADKLRDEGVRMAEVESKAAVEELLGLAQARASAEQVMALIQTSETGNDPIAYELERRLAEEAVAKATKAFNEAVAKVNPADTVAMIAKINKSRADRKA